MAQVTKAIIEAAERLTAAIEAQKTAIRHLTEAVTETEASRNALHGAGLQCWIDKLDTESNGHG